MKQYHNLLERIKDFGDFKGDRTGTGTQSIFGHQMVFDLREGFPLVTTKKIHFKSVVHELIWLLSGDTNIKYLSDNGVRIWNEWADENGDLGNVYGKAWRDWVGDDAVSIDQISNVVERIKSNPDCRRLIVSAWNPSWLPDTNKSFSENVKNGKGALPPCHAFFQFYTTEIHPNDRWAEFQERNPKEVWYEIRESEKDRFMDECGFPKRYVDVQLYQRSADSFLGVPFNIASYSLLLMMLGQVVNMIPRNFVHTFGDVHIYNNHQEQTDLQLTREFKELPKVRLNPDIKSVLDFKYEDVELFGYDPHPLIKGKVAI